MDNEKAIEKIRKLLRLAESADVNEATAAAAKAQRLMEAHRIDQAILAIDQNGEHADEIRDYDDDEALFSARRLPSWKSSLAWVLASTNACETYRSATWRVGEETWRHCIGLIGRPADVEAVRYLFKYLAGEIERLCKQEGRGKGRIWANSFKLGAVAEVRRLLNQARARARAEARRRCAGDTTALVKVDQAINNLDTRAREVAEWMKEHIPEMDDNAPESTSKRNWIAFRRGREAARTIDLEPAEKRIQSGHKALRDEGEDK